MTERERILKAARASGLRVRTYEVRFAGPFWRNPPCVVDAHTIDAAIRVANAEHPGMWTGQVVVLA